MEGDSSEPSKKSACVECRQQKVRCIRPDATDSTCERCVRKGKKCVVDTEYKRTVKRQKIAQLEREMATMRRQLTQNRVADGVPVIDVKPDDEDLGSDRVVPNDKLPPAAYKSVQRSITSPQNVLASVLTWECEAKAMDEVFLTAETVNALFREFLLHYHPIMPVVNISNGIEHIYRQSTALFWTIMATASRRYNDGELVTKLSGLQKTCLAEIAVSPVIRDASGQKFNFADVYAVQAFVIGSLWPLPTSSFNADSSWNTCGIAICTAIRAGLHLPGYHREFGRINQQQPSRPTNKEQCITWLATNIVGQLVAGVYGYPSVASFNQATVVQGLDIPLNIYVGFMIGLVSHDIETSMNSNTREHVSLTNIGERLSLIRILSVRIDEIEREYSASFDDQTWFALLSARVQLYSYYFIDNSSLSSFQVQRAHINTYNACLALLEFVQQAQTRNESYLRYAPLANVQLLWQAAVIVCRLYHSRWSSNLDKRKARDLYFKTVEGLNKASILEHDVAFRAAEVMLQMWSAFSSMATNQNERIRYCKVKIGTRMSASVFFDSLWTLREECEILSHAPTVLTAKKLQQQQQQQQQMMMASQTQTQAQAQAQGQVHAPGSVLPGPQGPHANGAPPNPNSPHTALPISPYVVSNETSPEMHTTPEQLKYDWDATAAWKDVNSMMEEFGFQFDNY